jgi:hypothetical protein
MFIKQVFKIFKSVEFGIIECYFHGLARLFFKHQLFVVKPKFDQNEKAEIWQENSTSVLRPSSHRYPSTWS